MRPKHAACLRALEPTESAIWGDQTLRRSWLVAVRLPARCSLRITQIIDLRALRMTFKGMKSNNRNLHRNIHKKGAYRLRCRRTLRIPSILSRILDETADRVTAFNRQQDDFRCRLLAC